MSAPLPADPSSTRPVSRGWTLDSLLADLELQAAGQADADRDDEVSALAVAHYAGIGLADRLHGALTAEGGAPELELRSLGGHQVRGRLVRVGSDFVLIETTAHRPLQWAVSTAALSTVGGLAPRSLVDDARPLTSRLGLRSLLRDLAEQGVEVRLVSVDGAHVDQRIDRAGADFIELADGRLVPLAAIAAVCLR